MKYLLDTNIVSEGIIQPNGKVARKISRHGDKVAISIISACELRYGDQRSPVPRRSARIDFYLKTFPVLELQSGMAAIYGSLRVHLENAGTPIGGNDLLIAAQALHQKLIIVTRNEKEFRRVPGLKVENWRDA
jgi:tRNA(fMet)-specific endonuclease VapC